MSECLNGGGGGGRNSQKKFEIKKYLNYPIGRGGGVKPILDIVPNRAFF